MKLKLSSKASQLGAALVTALVVGTILCISIVGYLCVTEQQTLLSARSQAWNMAITIVEAGIEEGLQQCVNNWWDLSVDGWNKSGNLYTRSRSFPDGSTSTIIIDNTNPNTPTVQAQATVASPTFVQRGVTTWFAATGIQQSGTLNPSVSRAVLVHTSRGSLFKKAMAARSFINLNGNNIYTDSFDSADPMKSRYGMYDPTVYKGDKGDVACNASIVNAVAIGNANIYGHVATGPGGTDSFNSNGTIGSHAWVAANPGGHVQPGWVTDDSNFTVPPTDFPYNGSSPNVRTVDNVGGNVVTSTNQITATNYSNTTIYPNPVPPGGVTTNMVNPWTTNNVQPSPMPYGEVTNTFWTSNVLTYPSPGSYIPPVYTNFAGQSGNIKQYSFQSIRNYAWPTLSYNYTLYGTNVIYTTNHYDHIISVPGNYYTTTLSGDTIVTAPGVRLVVANGMDLSANSHNSFTMANGATSGAAFQLYLGGTSLSISSDVIHNLGLYAGNFICYCAPSVTSMSFGGNSEFSGVLVAPNVDLALNGGGSGYMDFVGSLIVKSVTMTGHYHFHWDEAMGRIPSNPRVLITSWDEVAPVAAN